MILQDKSTLLDNESVLEKLNKLKALFSEVDSQKPKIIQEKQARVIKSCFKWDEELKASKFPIAFAGVFSAGKSIIINNILKQSLLPSHQDKTTAFPTIIRKSTHNKAVLHFFNEEEVNSIINHLINNKIKGLLQDETIRDGFNINYSIRNNPDYKKLISEIDRYFQEDLKFHKDNSLSKQYEPFENKELRDEYIPKLINYIDNYGQYVDYENKQLFEEISVEEVKSIKEGDVKALFIKKVEIFISDDSLPSNFVLVDLPGIGVTNNQHEEFSRNYLKNEAKAVVLCLKSEVPGKALQELFFSIDTDIRDRVFWLVNKWDTVVTHEHQKEVREGIESFIEKNSFEQTIDSIHNKPFYISALIYSFLLEVSNENLSRDSAKERASLLKKEVDVQFSPVLDQVNEYEHLSDRKVIELSQDYISGRIRSCVTVNNFNSFKEGLFDFIDNGLRNKLLNSANNEINMAIRLLENILDTCDKNNIKFDGKSEYIVDSITQDNIDHIYDDISAKIESFRNKYSQNMSWAWSNNNNKEITNKLDKVLDNKNEIKLEVINQQTQGSHSDDFRVTINAIYKRIDLIAIIRGQMIDAIKDNFIKDMKTLKDDINRGYNDFLGEDVSARLISEKDENDIIMRIYGLSDSLSFEISNRLEELFVDLAVKKKSSLSFDEIIEYYKESLSNYYNNDLSIKLEGNLSKSMKNHAVFFSSNLEGIIKSRNHKREMFALVKQKVINSPEVRSREKQVEFINLKKEELKKLRGDYDF